MKKTGILRRALFLSVMSLFLLVVASCASTPLGMLEQALNVLSSPAGDAIFSTIDAANEAAEEITPENEYYIGRSVAAAITAQYPVYKDAPQTTAYLNAICGAITMNSDMPFLYKGYYVAILDTDEINAMATPGGHIFVSRGLIKACTSEDALAAVIAHEIGHIQLKHSIEAIKSSRVAGALGNGLKAAAMVGVVLVNDKIGEDTGISLGDEAMENLLEATASFADVTGELAGTLLSSGFSKSQEYDADEKALSLMAAAGYDPNAIIDMLQMIPTGGNHGWDATHPAPQDRIKKVNKALKNVDMPSISSAARSARAARFAANMLP